MPDMSRSFALSLKGALTSGRSRALFLSVALLCGLGCSDESTDPTVVDPAQQGWAVRLDQHAIQMSTVAPYDTITLATVVLNGFGNPLAGSADVVLTSTDTSMRFHSDDGGRHTQLTVRRATLATGVKVVARATVDGVTFSDTAVVVVDEISNAPGITAYTLESVDINKVVVSPSWSLSTGVLYSNPWLRVAVRGPANGTIIPKSITSATTDIMGFGDTKRPGATVTNVSDESGMISSTLIQRKGTVMLHASTTWYGVIHRDSLMVTVVDPLYAQFNILGRTLRGSVTPVPAFDVGMLTVAAGVVVEWINKMGQPATVNFEEPIHALAVPDTLNVTGNFCAAFGVSVGQHGGNILLQSPPKRDDYPDDFSYSITDYCTRRDFRYFPTPGTYRFHTPTGAKGVVVVN